MAKVKPIGALAKDLKKVKDVIESEQFVYQAGQIVWKVARENVSRTPRKYSTGELMQSIGVTVDKRATSIVAHIGTNLSYAPYIEFGTGQEGAASATRTSPEVAISYRSSPWWIHKDMVDPAAAEAYGWFKHGDYQKVNGQPAKPYLYPALKDNEQIIADILAEGWEPAIRKATK